MAIIKLKLGKRSSFVKSRLLRHPQENDVWEADFQLITDKDEGDFWLGMVVDQETRVEFACQVQDAPPTVNDLARLLAEAIQRPITEGTRHRPSTLLLREEPQWEELLRHLQDIGIEVVKADRLPIWTEVAEQSTIQHAKKMRSLGSFRVTQDSLLALMFPALGQWVRHRGWIEMGNQADSGLAVRAFDGEGLVFETREARTLDEALSALEQGIAEFTDREESDRK